MAIDRPGIYPDMLAAEYYADPCPAPSLTQSVAKVLLDRSPLHAKCAHPRLQDPVQADEDQVEPYVKAQAIGSAAHALMLGRGKEIEVADFDSWRSNDAKAVRENAERLGKVPILSKHFDVAVKMVGRAREQLAASDVADVCDAFNPEHGLSEVCIAWAEDGFWFRALIDWVATGLRGRNIYDYKTTGMSCAPHMLSRMIVEMGWDIQAAMIERGLAALDPASAGRRKFRFVAQENAEPFALVVVEMTEAVLTLGRKKLDYAIRLWRTCMNSGVWPAYPTGVMLPEYPTWAEAGWLVRELAEADAATSGNVLMAG